MSWRCFYRVTASRQTNIRGFGSVPVTALLVYLFQLLPVIFTYLRAVRPCDVTTFLDLTSFRLLTGSGRVGSRVSNPDPVPSLPDGHLQVEPKTTNKVAAFNRCLTENTDVGFSWEIGRKNKPKFPSMSQMPSFSVSTGKSRNILRAANPLDQG